MYPAQTATGFGNINYVGLDRPPVQASCVPGPALYAWSALGRILAAIVSPHLKLGISYLFAYLVLRFSMAWTVGIWGIRDVVLRRKLWLVPLRDAIHFLVWVASFTSNRITWGDAQFELKDGRMIEIPPETNS
jgi:hypothetical protein